MKTLVPVFVLLAAHVVAQRRTSESPGDSITGTDGFSSDTTSGFATRTLSSTRRTTQRTRQVVDDTIFGTASVLAETDTSSITPTIETTPSALESSTVISATGSPPSISIPTNVLTITVAATPTSTPATADAGTNGGSDRTAVVALSTVLGALVLGIGFVIFFLCQRRRRRAGKHQGSIFDRTDDPTPAATAAAKRGSGSWFGSRLGSMRGHGRSKSHTAQPLMSEGSPRYGFFSPRFPATREAHMPLSSAQQARITERGQSNDSQESGDKALPYEEPSNAFSQPEARASAISANSRRPLEGQDDIEQAARLVTTHSGSSTPPISSSTKINKNRSKAAALLSKITPSTRSSTTANPTPTTTVMTPATVQQGGSRNSGTREIATQGLRRAGEGPDIASSEPGRYSATTATGVTDRDQKGYTSPADSPTKHDVNSQALSDALFHQHKTSADSGARPRTPRLDIPTSLVPGRKKSKKARFSIPGDVSPPTEGNPSLEIERQSTAVSPITPERGTLRSHPDRYPSVRTILSREDGSRKSSRRGTAPKVKRKPVPLNLSIVSRKPLPIPTSKYQYKELPRPHVAAAALDSSSHDVRTERRTYQPEAASATDVRRSAAFPYQQQQTRKSHPQIPNSSQPRKPPHNTSEPTDSSIRGQLVTSLEQGEIHGQMYGRLQPSQMSQYGSGEATPRAQASSQVPHAQKMRLDQVPQLKQPSPPLRRQPPQVSDQGAFPYGSYGAQQPYMQSYVEPQPPPQVRIPPQPPPPTPQYPQHQLLHPAYGQSPPSRPLQHLAQFQPLQQNPYIPPELIPSSQAYRHVTTTTAPALMPAPSATANGKESRKNRASAPLWRDSQQDAWRDSTSRTGSGSSDIAAAPGSETGTNQSLGRHQSVGGVSGVSGTSVVSEGSSGGGGGPGLWGAPGFFGSGSAAARN